jgi:hypothetical protein
MSKIFISHSSANNAAALAVAQYLSEGGWYYFLDITRDRGLIAGERWQQALKAAADRCEAVLFLISPAWQASRWCLAEFLLAKQLGKTIFGVLIEAAQFDAIPPEMTAEWQLCDLVAGTTRRSFQVSQEPIVPASEVSFSEDGLARLKIGLQRVGLDASHFDWPPQSDPDRAPYRGLKALDAEDAAIFFGRDGAVVRGLDALRTMQDRGVDQSFVILGASGAGKSSFLRAGLLPRIRRDDARFISLPVIRPERAVLSGATGLAAALERAFKDREAGRSRAAIGQALQQQGGLDDLLAQLNVRQPDVYGDRPTPMVVIPIDQGEELFAAEAGPEASRFLEMLAQVLAPNDTGTPQRPRALAVIAIRADSYERLQTEPLLAHLSPHLFSLPAINPADYKAVVEGPARRHTEAGHELTIEPALTDRLVGDMEGADALPLLAFTLERLFIEHGGDGKLSLEDYEQLGGIRGSIEAAIEAAFVDPGRAPAVPADPLARERLLHAGFIPWLARVDPDTEERKRRVARWDETPPEARPLLERLVEQRLLVRDRRRLEGEQDAVVIEVAHEALLRTWPTLTRWLDEDAQALKLLEAVQRAANEWSKGAGVTNREPWLVHTGERLVAAEALKLRPDFSSLLGETGGSYLDACRARDDRVRQEKEERDEAARVAQERELEQAKALAETQRQRADEQARARRRQRHLSWGLLVLLGLALVATTYALQQSRKAEIERLAAVEQERRTAAALAESERGLLRAQAAELRVMIERLDFLKADAEKDGKARAIEHIEHERAELVSRLDETTILHRKKLAEAMGFRGDLDFLMKQEGNVRGIKLMPYGEAWIDPATLLGHADRATIKKRYEFLLTPDEMDAILLLVGKRGDTVKDLYEQNKEILGRIHLKSTDVARLIPEAAEPIWTRLLQVHPVLKEDATPASVHTALLSFAFDQGPAWVNREPFASAIDKRDWLRLADHIEAFHSQFSYPIFRSREANLIRAELKAREGGNASPAQSEGRGTEAGQSP